MGFLARFGLSDVCGIGHVKQITDARLVHVVTFNDGMEYGVYILNF